MNIAKFIRAFALLAVLALCFATAQEQPVDEESSSSVSSSSEDLTEVNCEGYEYPNESFTQSDISKVYTSVDATRDGPFKELGITKYATAFGVRVLAHKSVSDEKILHVVHLVAQLLDADADGVVDKPGVQQLLVDRSASLIIVSDDVYTKMLLSEDPEEGLPIELKFCPYSLDFEEAAKLVIDGTPEENCPEDLFKKDRSMAFVSDHVLGRSWPMVLADKADVDATPESVEEGEKYELVKTIYKKAIDEKLFDISKSGCPDNDVERCGIVMLVSWAASSFLGVDKCYCNTVGASKLCTKEELLAKLPELAKIVEEDVFGGVIPTGFYTPTDEEVIEEENVDEL